MADIIFGLFLIALAVYAYWAGLRSALREIRDFPSRYERTTMKIACGALGLLIGCFLLLGLAYLLPGPGNQLGQGTTPVADDVLKASLALLFFSIVVIVVVDCITLTVGLVQAIHRFARRIRRSA